MGNRTLQKIHESRVKVHNLMEIKGCMTFLQVLQGTKNNTFSSQQREFSKAVEIKGLQ